MGSSGCVLWATPDPKPPLLARHLASGFQGPNSAFGRPNLKWSFSGCRLNTRLRSLCHVHLYHRYNNNNNNNPGSVASVFSGLRFNVLPPASPSMVTKLSLPRPQKLKSISTTTNSHFALEVSTQYLDRGARQNCLRARNSTSSNPHLAFLMRK